MKKIITSALSILITLFIPTIVFAFTPATLTNGINRVPVYTEKQAQKYFNQNYRLETKSINLGSAIPVTPSLYESSLASPIGKTDTSMTLVLGTDRAGNALSGYFCYTLDGGTNIVEYACGTTAGTAVTSLVRGIDPLTGTTTVAALEFAHRRGASVKITDYPVLTILARILNGQDTIPNLLTYDTKVLVTSGSASSTLITKDYSDKSIAAGAPDATETVKGLSELATGAEAAAGTSAGGTGARLVPPNSLLNSNSSATTIIPVTGADGKLSANFIATSSPFNWTGLNSFTATTTIATSTIASTTITNLNLGGNSAATLFDNATSTIHYHPRNSGSTSKNSIGKQTISHGLGVTPRLIRITNYQANSTVLYIGSGIWTATNGNATSTQSSIYGDVTGESGSSTANSHAGDSSPNLVDGLSVAYLSSVNSTSFVIEWTSITGTVYFTWEAEY